MVRREAAERGERRVGGGHVRGGTEQLLTRLRAR